MAVIFFFLLLLLFIFFLINFIDKSTNRTTLHSLLQYTNYSCKHKKNKNNKKLNIIIVIIIQCNNNNYTNNNNNSRDSKTYTFKKMVMTDFSSKHFSYSKWEIKKHSSEQCQERKLEEN